MLAECMRHDQDIGKQDRPVETEPVDGLQGNLTGSLAIIGHREKSALLRPEFAVFRKVSTRLPHEPKRHAVSALSVQSIEQETRHRESLIQYISIIISDDGVCWPCGNRAQVSPATFLPRRKDRRPDCDSPSCLSRVKLIPLVISLRIKRVCCAGIAPEHDS